MRFSFLRPGSPLSPIKSDPSIFYTLFHSIIYTVMPVEGWWYPMCMHFFLYLYCEISIFCTIHIFYDWIILKNIPCKFSGFFFNFFLHRMFVRFMLEFYRLEWLQKMNLAIWLFSITINLPTFQCFKTNQVLHTGI